MNDSRFDASGWRWSLPPGTRLPDDLRGLLNDWNPYRPVGTLVKQNLQRRIERIDLPSGTVFLKYTRVHSIRAWVRELLRKPKAELEFDSARSLLSLGVPTAEPLAWGRMKQIGPADSVLITREVAGAAVLADVLEREMEPRDRRDVAVGLGELFGRCHDAGAIHPDPHPGNILHAADGTLVLLDVHSIRFGVPATWKEASANLVLLNRWFQLRASRADRQRFWRSYSNRRTALGIDSKLAAKQLEVETERSNLQFWNKRLSRCFGKHRHYRPVSRGGVRGHIALEGPAIPWEAWLADPDAPFRDPAAQWLKDSRSSSVVRLPGGVVYKRFQIRSTLDLLKNGLRRSSALRSWQLGYALRDRGLPTPKPLFVAHRHRYGLPAEGYLATEEVPEVIGLPAYAAACDERERIRLAECLGRLVRLMHTRQVSHRDLKAANILMSRGEPVLIDLVGARVGSPIPEAIRDRDIARLHASFLSARRSLKLRFLKLYLSTSNRAAWKSRWRSIDAATSAKVARNIRSGRPLA